MKLEAAHAIAATTATECERHSHKELAWATPVLSVTSHKVDDPLHKKIKFRTTVWLSRIANATDVIGNLSKYCSGHKFRQVFCRGEYNGLDTMTLKATETEPDMSFLDTLRGPVAPKFRSRCLSVCPNQRKA